MFLTKKNNISYLTGVKPNNNFNVQQVQLTIFDNLHYNLL